MAKISRALGIAVVAGLSAAVLAGCGGEIAPPHLRPLSKDAMMLLGKKDMRTDTQIFVRIFKEESELEIWKARDDGRFYHFKTYPICTWSGELGPKVRTGDKQAPEGFYTITKNQMNPKSSFHLSFNLGYPNAFDRAQGRTGDFLMVHGKCTSAGCYAMTDGLVEEIYALAREQFEAGHDSFEVHAFPFRMTDENMVRHRGSPHYGFWRTLKEGYDHFEIARQPPKIAVCERRYIVNADFRDPRAGRIDPAARCPTYQVARPEPFVPRANDKVAFMPHVVAPGLKRRDVMMSAMPGAGQRMGLGIPPELFELTAEPPQSPVAPANR
ncbi:MAG: murein L,D-transpeptidase [Hyphomicrobium sp.]|nr:murein L,D-transpeptidase [Hyphomicrobium sp.]MBN9268231.1 murein L,D-transpeptidase [Hyphomicrobium sp.]